MKISTMPMMTSRTIQPMTIATVAARPGHRDGLNLLANEASGQLFAPAGRRSETSRNSLRACLVDGIGAALCSIGGLRTDWSRRGREGSPGRIDSDVEPIIAAPNLHRESSRVAQIGRRNRVDTIGAEEPLLPGREIEQRGARLGAAGLADLAGVRGHRDADQDRGNSDRDHQLDQCKARYAARG